MKNALKHATMKRRLAALHLKNAATQKTDNLEQAAQQSEQPASQRRGDRKKMQISTPAMA